MEQPTVAEAAELIRAHLPPAHALLGSPLWDAAANEWRALVQMDGALVRCGFTISACCTYSHVLPEGS